MLEKEILVNSLPLKDGVRLQCIHGCVHYNQNPLCPPAYPDMEWSKKFIGSYEKVKVCYEIIEFIDNTDFLRKKSQFNKELVTEEYAMKRKGNYYAFSFISGACLHCEDECCKRPKCTERFNARMPICSTSIDIMHLATEILGLPKKKVLSFWKYNMSKGYFNREENFCLCLGLILF